MTTSHDFDSMPIDWNAPPYKPQNLDEIWERLRKLCNEEGYIILWPKCIKQPVKELECLCSAIDTNPNYHENWCPMAKSRGDE